MSDLFSTIARSRPQRPQNGDSIFDYKKTDVSPASLCQKDNDIDNTNDDKNAIENDDDCAPPLGRKKSAMVFKRNCSISQGTDKCINVDKTVLSCTSDTSAGTLDSSMPPRTKIICTIGPITKDPESLKKLMDAGMNVARLNFSHGNFEYYNELIQNIRKVTKESRKICAILLDTKGPEIRTIKLKDGKDIFLQKGQEFTFVVDEKVIGDKNQVAVTYPNFGKILKAGNTILVDDGLLDFSVIHSSETAVRCRLNNNGMLGENKGINLPGVIVDFPPLTEKDIADIKYGLENKVDFIAASFVRNVRDVSAIRELLGEEGNCIKIISKIENQEGLNNFDSILDASDGIMVARGDLGSEIPIEQVCIAQKMMISKCNLQGKIVITATQMLDSMIKNPSPTRAEVSDVANAVIDGSDCVMLSGETAKGSYPTLAVKMMADICREAEDNIDFAHVNAQINNRLKGPPSDITEAIASSAVLTAFNVSATAIVVMSESGRSARMVSKFRPSARIICVTVSEICARQALAEWGVYPILVGSMFGTESLISRVIVAIKKIGMCSVGDMVVVVSGTIEGVSGATDQIQIVKVTY